jgi:hypothetical protein
MRVWLAGFGELSFLEIESARKSSGHRLFSSVAVFFEPVSVHFSLLLCFGRIVGKAVKLCPNKLISLISAIVVVLLAGKFPVHDKSGANFIGLVSENLALAQIRAAFNRDVDRNV